ncbi:MAG TPA: antibiotic biosynthesis monooxygenase, partial [Terriglobales bacterium]|nr:antibiotic biosynthesis monooxygenase [Terriglobales bacterium]
MKTHSAHYLVIWEFQVKPEAKPAFEQAYGPAGDWARLFSQSPDYRGTQLLRDSNRSGRYLTLDRWTSREAFHQFKQAHQADYEAFDQRCKALTDNESLIWCDPVNIFESLGWFLHLSFRGQDQQQPRQVMATIDQADIRGSEP